MVTTGGTNLKEDIVRLYDPVHIIVATPGRIVDLMNKDLVKPKECRILVLDEVGHDDVLKCYIYQLSHLFLVDGINHSSLIVQL